MSDGFSRPLDVVLSLSLSPGPLLSPHLPLFPSIDRHDAAPASDNNPADTESLHRIAVVCAVNWGIREASEAERRSRAESFADASQRARLSHDPTCFSSGGGDDVIGEGEARARARVRLGGLSAVVVVCGWDRTGQHRTGRGSTALHCTSPSGG